MFKGISKDKWKATLLQFIRFGIVGVSSTAVQYGMEMLFYYVILVHSDMPENAKVIVTSAAAFIVSVTNAYIWNNRFVFKSGERKGWRGHLRAYLKTVLSYAFTGLLLSPALKMGLRYLGVPYYLASLATLPVTIPLNFLLNKFWAFKS